MSFAPASIFKIWRTERGILPSRTISRSTTGSVDARMAPPAKATTQENPMRSARGTAPNTIMRAVPGPKISTGTSHRRSISSTLSLTASRNSTRDRVSVATTSSTPLSGPISTRPRPRSPKANPSPRNSRGNEIGERSTNADASAVTVRMTAIRANPVRKSGNRLPLSIPGLRSVTLARPPSPVTVLLPAIYPAPVLVVSQFERRSA